MRIIHTSDWHLGKTLYKKTRYKEFEKFLNFLKEKIIENNVDILLISGDIFDSPNPSNKAKKLYYRFLSSLKNIDVVIISGNHDSPSFLSAPKEILSELNIRVITEVDIDKEVFVLKDKAIIGAIPFLRESDICNYDLDVDKSIIIKNGITNHFNNVVKRALELKKDNNLPIILLAHLGLLKHSDDGEKEIYIGTTLTLDQNLISDSVSYTALGHLHEYSKVGNKNIYYSGTPIPMSFSEKKDKKLILLDDDLNIKTINIPIFQELRRIKGNKIEIIKELENLISLDESIWVEIESCEDSIINQTILEDIVKDSKVEILRITNPNYVKKILEPTNFDKELRELDVYQVFDTVIKDYDEKDKKELKELYDIAIRAIDDNGGKLNENIETRV